MWLAWGGISTRVVKSDSVKYKVTSWLVIFKVLPGKKKWNPILIIKHFGASLLIHRKTFFRRVFRTLQVMGPWDECSLAQLWIICLWGHISQCLCVWIMKINSSPLCSSVRPSGSPSLSVKRLYVIFKSVKQTARGTPRLPGGINRDRSQNMMKTSEERPEFSGWEENIWWSQWIRGLMKAADCSESLHQPHQPHLSLCRSPPWLSPVRAVISGRVEVDDKEWRWVDSSSAGEVSQVIGGWGSDQMTFVSFGYWFYSLFQSLCVLYSDFRSPRVFIQMKMCIVIGVDDVL